MAKIQEQNELLAMELKELKMKGDIANAELTKLKQQKADLQDMLVGSELLGRASFIIHTL